MAWLSKIGNVLRQTGSASSPSIYQAIRCMSSSKVFVGGMSYDTDENSLREAFGKYGEVIEARVILDRETGRSKGFGFVTYTSSEGASNAIQALDGQDLHGRLIGVSYAKDRPRGGFGGGGYGAGGGYSGDGGYGLGGGYASGGGGYGAAGGYASGGGGYGAGGGYASSGGGYISGGGGYNANFGGGNAADGFNNFGSSGVDAGASTVSYGVTNIYSSSEVGGAFGNVGVGLGGDNQLADGEHGNVAGLNGSSETGYGDNSGSMNESVGSYGGGDCGGDF